MARFEDHCWRDILPPESLSMYRQFVRETRLGRRPALLAIDLYECVFAGGDVPVEEAIRSDPSSCGHHAWQAMAPIQRLFDLAHGQGWPIFLTTTETRPEVNPPRVRATQGPPPRDPAWAYAIRPEFAPRPEDVVIYKQRASGFHGTPLLAHLVHAGVDTLVVCGETTSGCVRASVVDGYSNGFHVVVVEECVFDRLELTHRVNLFDMHHKYADVVHLSELEGLLGAVEAGGAPAARR
jgi:maleamate amidohydrolase